MTTKFQTIKFAKFPNYIVMDFPRKNSVLGQSSVNFPPPPTPLQNANFINIVVSASLMDLLKSQKYSQNSKPLRAHLVARPRNLLQGSLLQK